MYTTIVVGTDGSGHALDAVRRAGQLARLSGSATVHVVHAIAPQSDYTVRAVEGEDGIVSRVSAPAGADQKVAAAVAELDAHDVASRSHVATGRPSGVILDVVDDVDADLIVVGARGLGPVGRFVRGSVSTRVAQHAPCDVLIVEHDDGA